MKQGAILIRSGKAMKNTLTIFGVSRLFFSAAPVSMYAVVNDSQMIDHDERYKMYHLRRQQISSYSIFESRGPTDG